MMNIHQCVCVCIGIANKVKRWRERYIATCVNE